MTNYKENISCRIPNNDEHNSLLEIFKKRYKITKIISLIMTILMFIMVPMPVLILKYIKNTSFGIDVMLPIFIFFAAFVCFFIYSIINAKNIFNQIKNNEYEVIDCSSIEFKRKFENRAYVYYFKVITENGDKIKKWLKIDGMHYYNKNKSKKNEFLLIKLKNGKIELLDKLDIS